MDILNALLGFLLDALRSLLVLLGDVLAAFFFWLPDDPFASVWPQLDAFADANALALQWLNWFVPVPQFAVVFSLVLSALMAWGVYMAMTHVLEWVRTIKSTINPGG